jgi:hypothetical protein
VTFTLARISIAPVKSLALVFPDEVELGADGVAGDRRFWITDVDGRLFNNKRSGPLALVRPLWNEGSRHLQLTFPDGEAVGGEIELGPEAEENLFGSPFPSRPVLGPWEDALSEYVGEHLHLLWTDRGATDRGRGGGTVSLVSTASLAELGRVSGAGGPLDGRRFRMLFQVDGTCAYEEDGWVGRRVQIGDAEVRFEGDVGRCLVTSQNPDTGITDVDTLGALARTRRIGQTEELPFGIYGRVTQPGRVRLGDAVVPEPG